MKLKIVVLMIGIVTISNAYGMSFEKFHQMAADPKTTGKQLVEAYDQILIDSYKRLAEIVLDKLRHTTIDKLRKELSGEPKESAKKPQEDEDWGI